jgi:hypothetical protein
MALLENLRVKEVKSCVNSTAERRELGLDSRRSARFSSLLGA